MKTRSISLLVISVLFLGACGGTTASTTVPPVIEDQNGANGDIAVPTGNAVNPQPVTDAVLDEASPDADELRFKVVMGVEPCDVIHSVTVTETATSVDVEILRGVGDVAATCIAIAVERTVVVDLEAPLGDRAVTLSGVALSA
jgi:hypothetical protein